MLCELYLNQKKKKKSPWTLLVTQWIRICLPMQGTQVWSLVQEDSTCCRAGKPIRQNYWARVLVPSSHSYPRPHAATTEAHAPRTCAPAKSRPCSAQLEKASAKLRRPSRAKLKKKKKKKKLSPTRRNIILPYLFSPGRGGMGNGAAVACSYMSHKLMKTRNSPPFLLLLSHVLLRGPEDTLEKEMATHSSILA